MNKRCHKEKRSPVCPRCRSVDTKPPTNFGRPVDGRFECLSCRRWFGPNNPLASGGTGEEAQRHERISDHASAMALRHELIARRGGPHAELARRLSADWAAAAKEIREKAS